MPTASHLLPSGDCWLLASVEDDAPTGWVCTAASVDIFCSPMELERSKAGSWPQPWHLPSLPVCSQRAGANWISLGGRVGLAAAIAFYLGETSQSSQIETC